MNFRFSPKIVLMIGVLAISTNPTLIKLAQRETHPLAVAMWCMILASALLTIPILTKKREIKNVNPREMALMCISGIFMAIYFAAMNFAFHFTSVAVAAVLIATNPLFVALISHFYLGEKIFRVMVIGLFVAMIGSMVIGSAGGQGTHHLMGDMIALGSALGMTGYLLIGRRLRAHLSTLEYIFPVYTVAAIFLIIATILSGVPVTGYSSQGWLLLLLLAFLPINMGHSLLNRVLRYLSATTVSLHVLISPIIATLLALIVLKEMPTIMAIVGGGFVLCGIFIFNWGKKS